MTIDHNSNSISDEKPPNDFVKREHLMQKIVPEWALNCAIKSGLYSSPEIRHQNGLDCNGKPLTCFDSSVEFGVSNEKNQDSLGNSDEEVNR